MIEIFIKHLCNVHNIIAVAAILSFCISLKFTFVGADVFGTDANDVANSYATDLNGNKYIGGFTSGLIGSNGDTYQGGNTNPSDAFIKVIFKDSTKQSVTRQFGGNKEDAVRAMLYDSMEDMSGGSCIWLAGYSYSSTILNKPVLGASDGFLTKYCINGNNDLYSATTIMQQTSQHDECHAMAIDGNRNIIVGGFTKGSMDGRTTPQYPVKYHAFFSSYNILNGNQKLFTTQIGDVGNSTVTALAIQSNTNDIFVAIVQPNNARSTIRKYNSQGAYLGQQISIGGASSMPFDAYTALVYSITENVIYATGFVSTSHGGYTVADGGFRGYLDGILQKINADSLSEVWIRSFGREYYDLPYSLAIDDPRQGVESGIIVGGTYSQELGSSRMGWPVFVYNPSNGRSVADYKWSSGILYKFSTSDGSTLYDASAAFSQGDGSPLGNTNSPRMAIYSVASNKTGREGAIVVGYKYDGETVAYQSLVNAMYSNYSSGSPSSTPSSGPPWTPYPSPQSTPISTPYQTPISTPYQTPISTPYQTPISTPYPTLRGTTYPAPNSGSMDYPTSMPSSRPSKLNSPSSSNTSSTPTTDPSIFQPTSPTIYQPSSNGSYIHDNCFDKETTAECCSLSTPVSIQYDANASYIPPYALSKCNISELLLGSKYSKVEKIYEGAFMNNSIQFVSIPAGVTHIFDKAFAFNKIKMAHFRINANLRFIGRGAFRNNDIRELMIPNSVVNISDFAFAKNNLTQIVFGTDPALNFPDYDDVYNSPTYAPVLQPSSSSYFNAIEYNGHKYATLTNIPPDESNRYCQNIFITPLIDWVVAPYNADTIHVIKTNLWGADVVITSDGFGVATSLAGTSGTNGSDTGPGSLICADCLLYDPSSASYMPKDMCGQVLLIYSPSQPFTAPNSTSYSSGSRRALTSKMSPANSNPVYTKLYSIGAGVFMGNSYLQSVVLPNSLVSIGPLAFANCPQLNHIVIPPSVKFIASSAFQGSGGGNLCISYDGCDEEIYLDLLAKFLCVNQLRDFKGALCVDTQSQLYHYKEIMITAFVLVAITVATSLIYIFDEKTRPVFIWLATPSLSYIGGLIYLAFCKFSKFGVLVACSVFSILWLVIFIYELVTIGAYPNKLFLHRQVKYKLFWLRIFNGYVTNHGEILNKYFENHDNLGKLFAFMLSWLFFALWQLMCYIVYVIYLVLHLVYWTILLVAASILYNTHIFCNTTIWNYWLGLWTLKGHVYYSSVAIDTQFVNRSLMAQYFLHDIPILIIIAFDHRNFEGQTHATTVIISKVVFWLIASNLVFILRFVVYSIKSSSLVISDAPLVLYYLNIIIEAGHREHIERRPHRTKEQQKPIKAFFLDVLLKARRERNMEFIKKFSDGQSKLFDLVEHQEKEGVIPKHLSYFTDALSEEDSSKLRQLLGLAENTKGLARGNSFKSSNRQLLRGNSLKLN